MSCKCGSNNGAENGAEMNIHRRGDLPAVLVFPKIVVCLDCGHAEFNIPPTELSLLREGASTAA
jgi:hypothetical protein